MVVGRISSERVTRVRGGDYLLLLLCNCTYCPFITDLKHLRYDDVYIQPMKIVRSIIHIKHDIDRCSLAEECEHLVFTSYVDKLTQPTNQPM